MSGVGPVPMLLMAVMNTLMTMPGGTVMLAIIVSILGTGPSVRGSVMNSVVVTVAGMHIPLESRGQCVIMYELIFALLSGGTGQVSSIRCRLIRSKVIWVWLIMSGTAVRGSKHSFNGGVIGTQV